MKQKMYTIIYTKKGTNYPPQTKFVNSSNIDSDLNNGKFGISRADVMFIFSGWQEPL